MGQSAESEIVTSRLTLPWHFCHGRGNGSEERFTGTLIHSTGAWRGGVGRSIFILVLSWALFRHAGNPVLASRVLESTCCLSGTTKAPFIPTAISIILFDISDKHLNGKLRTRQTGELSNNEGILHVYY